MATGGSPAAYQSPAPFARRPNSSYDSRRGGEPGEAMNATERVEEGEASDGCWQIRLYLAGVRPKSAEAILGVKRLCDRFLEDYRLQLVDATEGMDLVREDDPDTLPCLVRKSPGPEIT